jgi:hypothetical protein
MYDVDILESFVCINVIMGFDKLGRLYICRVDAACVRIESKI